MAITCTKLDSGVNGTATSSFSSNSISSPTGRLLLACFITCEGTRTHTCTDDNGNSWTKISEGHYDTDRTISWHYLIVPGTPLSSNIVICTPSGTHNQGHWCVLEINGHDGTTPIAQSPAIATGSGTTLSKTLSSPAGSGSKHFICVGQSVFQALSPDANTTELADHSGNSAGSPLGNAFAVGWSNADFETTCGFTGSTSGNWGALSIEVAEPSSGTNVDVPSALVEDETTNTPTFSATADVTPGALVEDELFASASLSATAAVTAPQRVEVESFNTPTFSTTAGVTPNPLVEVESFSAATLSSTAAVTPTGVLETESFNVPTVGVVTNVNVPAAVLETESFNTPTIVATVSGTPVVETEQFNTPTFSATAAVTAPQRIEVESFSTPTISAVAGVTPSPVLETEQFQTASLSSTAAVTPNSVLEVESFPPPVVEVPGSVVPLPFQETELFPGPPTFTANASVTPNPVLERETFPSSAVDDGTGTAGQRRVSGIVWINEPWTHWPDDEEALV